MTTGRQTPQSSVKFLECTFTHLIASGMSGGAIYYIISGGSLQIVECVFDSCETTINEASGTGGGAVFVSDASELTMSCSVFQSCVVYTSNSGDGGAIEMLTLSSNLLINNCIFLRCVSGDDGGAICMWDFPSWQKTCVTDSRFILCEGRHPDNADGGSVMIWRSKAAIGFSNTLFGDSHATYRGGALCYYIYSTEDHHSSIHLITFCFFRNNSVESDSGNDIYFNDWIPDKPFLHCFSITKENSICYVIDDVYHFDKDNWLPQGKFPFFVNVYSILSSQIPAYTCTREIGREIYLYIMRNSSIHNSYILLISSVQVCQRKRTSHSHVPIVPSVNV